VAAKRARPYAEVERAARPRTDRAAFLGRSERNLRTALRTDRRNQEGEPPRGLISADFDPPPALALSLRGAGGAE